MIKEGRMVGNTTRVVDKCIQDLFEKRKCVCRDNIDVKEAHKLVFHKVSRRLQSEHKLTWNKLKIDFKDMSYSLSEE
jgi:hypothetical protein